MKLRLPRTRRYRVYLYVASITLIVLAVDLVWVRIGRHVRVGYDTTRIAGPLRGDGLPDYMRAIEEKARAGVTAENNAAPLLLRAIGPDLLQSERAREVAYAGLGMEPLSMNGAYFKSHWELIEEAGKRLEHPRTEQEMIEEYVLVTSHPWAEAEHPDIGGWLRENQGPLALVSQARERSRFFLPRLLGKGLQRNEMVSAMPLANLGSLRQAGTALVARAMQRGKNGDFDGARDDLLSSLHLASLLGTNAILIETLVAVAAQQSALRGVRGLATSELLSAAQARRLLEDLDRSPAAASFIDALETERLGTLDSVLLGVRMGPAEAVVVFSPPERHRTINGEYPTGMAIGDFVRPVWPGNFNQALRDVNAYYDRMIAAYQAPSFALYQRDSSAVENDLSRKLGRVHDAYFPDTAQLLLSLAMPHLSKAAVYKFMARAELDITRVSLALAAYHADHREYPEALGALMPTYLRELPADIFMDAPLHYVRRGRGYLAYSVGMNMKDDEGQTREQHDDAHGRADDISVRVGE